MTLKKAIQVRDFAIAFATKTIAKRKDYGERLEKSIRYILPKDDGSDGYGFLGCKTWDEKDEGYAGVGDWLDDVQYCDGDCYGLYPTDKGQADIRVALRVAVDLFIEQSCGVAGYSLGDLKKAFDGEIPDEILLMFDKPDELTKSENDHLGIWL